MSWNCEYCTFLNSDVVAGKCEVCEMSRNMDGAPPPPLPKPKNSNKPTVQLSLSGRKVPKETTKPKQSKKRKAPTSSDVVVVVDSSGDNPAGDATSSAARAPPSKRPAAATQQATLSHLKGATGHQARDLCCPHVAAKVPFAELKVRAKAAMEDIFHVKELRFLQPQAIRTLLKHRRSQVVVMATGGGKSLCYQLPAVVLGGTAIVVSPLIALMHDQVQSLVDKGVAAAVISSSNGEKHNNQIRERLLGRSLRVKASKEQQQPPLEHITLLYVTPEQVQTDRFRDILAELHKKKRLSLFAIDEAHCLSSWGHDFRKAYLQLDYLRRTFPAVPLLACTATATTKVLEDIRTTLLLQDCPCHVGSFDRPNIFYKVKYKDTLDAALGKPDGGGGGAAGDLAKFVLQQKEQCAKDNTSAFSGIVYVHTRVDTADLAFQLRTQAKVTALAYHGGLKPAERTQVQEDWTSGKCEVVVATVAFGMGYV